MGTSTGTLAGVDPWLILLLLLLFLLILYLLYRGGVILTGDRDDKVPTTEEKPPAGLTATRKKGCPDNCPEVCKNRNCHEITEGFTGSRLDNPDQGLVSDAALEVLGGEGVSGESSFPGTAAKKVATEKAKDVQEIAKMKTPTLWVKFGWEHCEDVWCGIWHPFTWHKDWVKKTKWVMVEPPADYRNGEYTGKHYWAPLSEWTQEDRDAARAAIAKVVKDMLADCQADKQL